MLTLLFAALVLGVLWRIVKYRPWAALAGAFLLFSLVTRTVAVAYLDFAGPVYAVELGDEVGGGGSSMPLFALSVLAFMLPLSFVFRKEKVASWLAMVRVAPKARGLANIVFMVIALFLFAAYADMVARGPIPLFSGIDRLDYSATLAGPLHPPAYEFVFLFAFSIGMLFVYPRLRGGDFDLRFAALAGFYLLYHVLTGNRFSIFYAFAGYFVIPFAALPALRSVGALPPVPADRSRWLRRIYSKAAIPFILLGSGLIIAALVFNSLVNVRAYDDPAEQFAQRVLIQPVQLWWSTWSTLHTPSSDGDDAWYAAFVNPIDATRNTSIQVLMIKNLGGERAEELILQGQQYAGGYPEILFELLGPWAALPVALLFGCATSMLLRLCVASVCKGHLVTALMALYVCFGFNLLYIGGMLNFLIGWTFTVKLLALLVASVSERRLARLRMRKRSPRAVQGLRPALSAPRSSPAT